MADDRFSFGPARPEDAEGAADLIYDTDPHLFSYLYRDDLRALRELLSYQWRQEAGVFSHGLATAARSDGDLVGIELGYGGSELEGHNGATRAHLRQRASPDLLQHMGEAFRSAGYLVPRIPERAYYVQNLAVAPEVRGTGIGQALLGAAFARAAQRGYRSCHLDVDATNPAVRFYLRMGMEVWVETRVRVLEGRVPAHYRMVKDLA